MEARRVFWFFDRGVMLDGDHIGAVQPFQIYDDERIEYLYQTMRYLVASHVEHGYGNFDQLYSISDDFFEKVA